jgi:hypothetical protein
MTKTKISKKTELHINTVYNLWYEEEIQSCLEEYNKWLKEYKKPHNSTALSDENTGYSLV